MGEISDADVADPTIRGPKDVTVRPAIVNTAVSLAVFAIAAAISWHGLGNWDALYYVKSALNWLIFGPTIGETHWALRYPLVVPIAASIAAIGTTEFAATLPSIIYSAGIVVVSAWFGTMWLGKRPGLVLGVLVAASAPLTLVPLGIEIRGPETLFVVWAIWLFAAGTLEDRRWPTFFCVGILSGLAWLCREVSAFLPLTLVISAFVFVPRSGWSRAILVPSAAFALVLIGELAFYFLAAGDPIYRYRVDLGHVETTLGHPGDPLGAGTAPSELLETTFGPFFERLISPITGPHFLAGAIAALIIFARRRSLDRPTRRILGIFAIAVAISFATGAFVFNLKSPRYFTMIDYFVLVLLALALQASCSFIWRISFTLGVVALVALGPIATDVSLNFAYASVKSARQAVVAAKEEDEPIAANRWIVDRGVLLLRLEGWSEAAARAEFIDLDIAPLDTLVFIAHDKDPCKHMSSDCPWQLVRSVGETTFGWTYPALAWLSSVAPVPDRFRHDGPQVARLYRYTAIQQQPSRR